MSGIIQTWLAVALLSAAAGGEGRASGVECLLDADGYCSSQRVSIELDAPFDTQTAALNIALGDVVTIRLREPLAIKTCEDHDNRGEAQVTYCGVANGNASVVAFSVEERLIKVSAKTPENLILQEDESATDALWHEHASLQLVTESGQQVTFDMRVRYPTQAVKQVLISSPQMMTQQREFAEKCEAHMETESRKLQREWGGIEATARRLAADNMTYSLMAHRRCKRGSWTNMQDLLWVRVVQLCHVDDNVHVTAHIENRSESTPFEVDELVLVVDESNDDEEAGLGGNSVSTAFERVSPGAETKKRERVTQADVRLRYGEGVLAGVSVYVGDGTVPKQLALRVHELGGGQRVVRVGGISF